MQRGWTDSKEGLDQLLLMAKVAKSVTVIDHHKTSLPVAESFIKKRLPTNVAVDIQSPQPCASTYLYRILSQYPKKSTSPPIDASSKTTDPLTKPIDPLTKTIDPLTVPVDDLTKPIDASTKPSTPSTATESNVKIMSHSAPDWLRVIDLHDTGRFSEMSIDDRSAHAALTDDLDALDGLRSSEWKSLVERGRFLIDTQRPLVAAGLVAKTEMKSWKSKNVYRTACIELPHEKFILAIQQAFWKVHIDKVDILALRMPLSGGGTDFKLRRPPTSQLDLSHLASLFANGGGHAAASGIQFRTSLRFLPDLQ